MESIKNLEEKLFWGQIFFWIASILFPIIVLVFFYHFYQAGMIIFGMYFVFAISFSRTNPNADTGLVNAKPNEVMIIECGGWILFAMRGGPMFLWPWIFRATKYDASLTDREKEMIAITSVRSVKDKGSIFEYLIVSGPMVWWQMCPDGNDGLTGCVIALKKCGSLDGAYAQTESQTQRVLNYKVSKITTQELITGWRKFDRALTESVWEFTGQNDKNSDIYVGVKTLNVTVKDPLPKEFRNKLIKLAEEKAEADVVVEVAKREAQTLIIGKKAEAAGVKLVGLSQVEVEKARKVYQVMVAAEGKEATYKRLGLKEGDREAALMIEALEQAPAILGDKLQAAVIGGEGGLINEVLRAITAVKTLGNTGIGGGVGGKG